MKTLRLAAATVMLVLVLAGCGKSEKAASTTKTEPGSTATSTSTSTKQPDTAPPPPSTTAVATPIVMPDVVSKKLDVALGDIKSAGFKDKVKYIGGGTFGVQVESNWTVCAQSPAAGQAVTDPPQLTVERSCRGAGADSTTSAPAPGEPPTTGAPEPEPILTAANSPDFAALLAVRDTCTDTEKSFGAKYQGRTIEFDGNIAQNAGLPNQPPLDRTDKRQDVLVIAGDYTVENGEYKANDGPTMKFDDVTFSELNLTGPNIPTHVGQGDNLHFVARIDQYNGTGCLFLLKPVSTSAR